MLAGVGRPPGPLRHALSLVEHLALCPEEVLAVIVDGLELEIEAVSGVLKDQKQAQSELQGRSEAGRRAAHPMALGSASLAAGHGGAAVEVAPRLLCLGNVSWFIKRAPLPENGKFSSE